MTRVAVCVVTLHRPEGLGRLLAGLARLEPPEGADVRVVVVDNDPAATARPAVERFAATTPWRVTYAVEARRGIPFARNRAVAEAGPVDFVAFVDDDEVPAPAWLAELLRVQAATGADVVTGPVVPLFEEPPPSRAVAGAFYERPRFATGTVIDYARTSNVLIGRAAFPAEGPAFTESLGVTAGTDTHFFMRAQLAGCRIVWADEAVVAETMPPSRVRVGWLVRRSYRQGNTLTLCLLDLRDSPVRRARRAAQGVLRLLQGLGLLVLAARGDRVRAVRGLQRLAYGAGLLSGLAGARYDEYRTVHGR